MGDLRLLTMIYDKLTTLSLDLTIQTDDIHVVEAKSSSPGSNPGQGHYVEFLGKNLTLTVPLSTQVFKWIPANIMLGVTLRWSSIPSREE